MSLNREMGFTVFRASSALLEGSTPAHSLAPYGRWFPAMKGFELSLRPSKASHGNRSSLKCLLKFPPLISASYHRPIETKRRFVLPGRRLANHLICNRVHCSACD